MEDNLQERFSPAGTQHIDVRGLDLNRPGYDENEDKAGETEVRNFEVESVESGVEALLSEDTDRPETIDAVNVYVARNAEKLTPEAAANLKSLVENRKDGNPEKRRQALEAIYGVERDVRAEQDAFRREADAKKVDQTSRLMNSWQKEMSGHAGKDGIDVMKAEFAQRLDVWTDQVQDIYSPEADALRARIAQARTEFLRGGKI